MKLSLASSRCRTTANVRKERMFCNLSEQRRRPDTLESATETQKEKVLQLRFDQILMGEVYTIRTPMWGIQPESHKKYVLKDSGSNLVSRNLSFCGGEVPTISASLLGSFMLQSLVILDPARSSYIPRIRSGESIED